MTGTRRRNPAFLVLWNTGIQIGARGAAALIGVVQVGVLSHALLSKRYGEYGFVLAVIGLCGMLSDMGLNQVAIRALRTADDTHRSRTLGNVLTARMYLAVSALITTNVFAFVAPIDSVERTGIVLMSVSYLVTVPAALFSLFQAELELQYPLIITIAQSALTLGLTVALVIGHASLLQFLGVLIVAPGLGAAAMCGIAVRRYHLTLRLHLRDGLAVLRESLPVGVSQILVVLYFRIDAILLGLIRGPVDVAHYSAAYKFVDLGSFGAVAFMSAVYPMMIQRGRESDRGSLITTYQRSIDILMFVALPATLVLFVLARPIIFLVFPSDFSSSIDALRVLSITLLPLFINNVLGAIVLAVHRERTFLWVSLGATVLNIGLNVLFIPSFGIIAAAIITVATELFVTVTAVYLMWRVLRFVPSLRKSALALLGTGCMALPLYAVQNYWPFALVLGGALYLAVTWRLRLWSVYEVRAAFIRA